MAHSWHHAVSSAKKFGGVPDDYVAIHSWFDETKQFVPNWRHRAMRHHTVGIFEAERVFGVTIVNSDGKHVPVRVIGEQHVMEDCRGRIPTPADWLGSIQFEKWMAPDPKDVPHG